jgi:biopolymer transport protein TolR
MAMGAADLAANTSKRRRHRRGVISEINVTPMVDVMLVLLIIFMVAAPLLTVSIPVDLPEAKAQVSTKAKTEQLTVTAR